MENEQPSRMYKRPTWRRKFRCDKHPDAPLRHSRKGRNQNRSVQVACTECMKTYRENTKRRKEMAKQKVAEEQQSLGFVVSCDEAVGNPLSPDDEFARLLAQVQDPELREVIVKAREQTLIEKPKAPISYVPAITVAPAPPITLPEHVSNNVGSEALTGTGRHSAETGAFIPPASPEKPQRDPSITKAVMLKAREIAHRIADMTGAVSGRQIYDVMELYGHPGLMPYDRSSMGGVFKSGWVRTGFDEHSKSPTWSRAAETRVSKPSRKSKGGAG